MAAVWLAIGMVLGVLASLVWDLRQFNGQTRSIIEGEKRDQARFAATVLLTKATVASRVAEVVIRFAPRDPEAIAALIQLYEEVASTWLPEDADASLHKLKLAALEAARNGQPVVLH